MARIVGVDLPDKKRIDFALTRVYGIGRSNVQTMLKSANIDAATRTHELSDAQVSRLQKTVEQIAVVEGNLRQQLQENIKRLKQIGSYRGQRHIQGLPANGQRTRSNARTKRGKRQTVGAMRKEMRAKMEQTANK